MRRVTCAFALLAAAALIATPLTATTLLKMDLGELVQRADRIFRGTVVDVEQGSIQAGGGELPVVTYRLRVEESFKGGADMVKGDRAMIEVRMVGSIKAAPAEGDHQRLSAFRDVPRLSMGGDYLLLTTPPSAIGLSTTVGLGQGAFTVFSLDKEDYAVNQFDNAGLGLDGTGAVPYAELADKIRALLGG